MNINIGSSSYLLDDFINLDNNWLVFFVPFYPVIKGFLKPGASQWIERFREKSAPGRFRFTNCRKKLPFDDESADHILASHFLEHLYHDMAIRVLHDWKRVLKPGGTLHLIVPDLASRAQTYVGNLGDPKAAGDFFSSLNVRTNTKPSFLKQLLPVLLCSDAGHCWMYDQYSLKALVTEIGFELLPNLDCPSESWRKDDGGQINILVRKP